jgi:phage-related protein
MPILGALKDILLTIFVELWNIIVATVMSLITAFKPLGTIVKDVIGIFTTLFGLSDSGSESFLSLGSAVDFTVALLQSISDAIQFTIGFIGALINIIMQLVRVFFLLFIAPLQAAMADINAFADSIARLIDIFLRGVGSSDKGLTEYLEDTVELINAVRKQFDKLPERIESGLNSIVSQLNAFIERINDIFMTDISTVGRINITGGDLQTTRDELSRDTKAVGDDLARVAPNIINMKEENNQTVNQSIDADPEDKSTVSRVVEDAIERANRFERTRAGQ